MFDKEIEALAKCSELIQGLEEDARIRVIKYLIEKYWIGLTKSPMIVETTVKPNLILTQNKEDEYNHNDSYDYPNLKDLVIKDAPKNEAEWTLIYWFYSSHFGEDHFSKEDIIWKYDETKRKTTTRMKNLWQSLSTWINKDWYKSVNDKEFIILEAWKNYAIEIIQWKSQWSSRKRTKKTTPKS